MFKDNFIMSSNTVCTIIKFELIKKHDTVYTDNHLKGHPELLEGYARLEFTIVCFDENVENLVTSKYASYKPFYFIIIRYSVVFLNPNVLQHMRMYTAPFMLNFSVFR